jgi:outer membrane lipoprotein-sorting protein
MKRLLSLLLLLPLFAHAAVDANALLAEADQARGGNLPGLAWTISIDSHDGDGDTRRVMQAIAGDNNTRVDYTEPAKMRGQRIVMQGRNMWFIRPGLQRPIPLSPRQRLIGNAANGDLAATNYAADYAAELAGTELIDGDTCAILELKAKAHNTTYDRIRYWVSEKRKLGVKAEFYTVSGKVFKLARFEYGNEIAFEGRRIAFVSKMTITDAINADQLTTLRYSEVRVKRPDPSLFELTP